MKACQSRSKIFGQAVFLDVVLLQIRKMGNDVMLLKWEKLQGL